MHVAELGSKCWMVRLVYKQSAVACSYLSPTAAAAAKITQQDKPKQSKEKGCKIDKSCYC
jgi:hypothetical protein